MEILIAGAGGLGSIAGAYLSDDHEVTLLGRESHVQQINTDGLLI